MVIDASAVLAIFFREPKARAMAEAIADAPVKRMSAAGWLECAIRLDNAAEGASLDLEEFVRQEGIAVEAATPEHARLARLAHRRFGKGRHPARLNFGDCLAYALAVERGEALLFKGEDFAQTDITPALSLGGGDR